jgi:drug/metabolite transporter (DMT)-like permease
VRVTQAAVDPAPRPRGIPPAASFVIVSVVWGLTWPAGKIALSASPPLFLAGTRFTAAGLILAVLLTFDRTRMRADLDTLRGQAPMALAIAALMTPICYGPLFWGMRHSPSGLAAVVNLGLIPPTMAALGVLTGAERVGLRGLAAIVLGLVGLGVMFLPQLQVGQGATLAGLSAIAFGSVAYCLGSVLSRRYLPHISPIGLSAFVMGAGGLMLLPAAMVLEPVNAATISAMLAPSAASAWLFLVLAGSVLAFTLYLELLREWGPLRSGFYAFVSPLIALVSGALMFGESLGAVEALGAAILIAASFLAMTRQRGA